MEEKENLLIECQACGFKWNGDHFDEDCPSCESEDIKIVG